MEWVDWMGLEGVDGLVVVRVGVLVHWVSCHVTCIDVRDVSLLIGLWCFK